MRSRPVAGYSLLFFLSGATGLVYELLWVRLLYQSFGTTVQSVTTVVAAYMGGLGLGALAIGRRADRHPNPARLYGILEILIGCFGLASPFILHATQQAYVGLARSLALQGGSVASVSLRFGLAWLVLLIPTTLMGGTLPVLTRALTVDREHLRASLGRLYGLNTLGAVVGTLLAGFWLIENVGIRGSLWGVALINLMIGAAAVLLSRAHTLPFASRPQAPGPSSLSGAAADPAAAPPLRLWRLALILLAVTAFASLLDEIAWTRVLVMIVGGSTYGFTLILMVFLLGIGIGSAIVARIGRPALETAATAALAQGITAAGAALLFLSLSALPHYILIVFQNVDYGGGVRLFRIGLAVVAVVLPPAIGMGMTFPLLTDIVASRGEARSSDVGWAYAVNTLGSIIGAVLTGFVLVSVLGTDRTLRLGLWVNGLAALSLAVSAAWRVPEASAQHQRLRAGVLGGGLLACLGLAVAVGAPGWGPRLIDIGPTIYGRGLKSPALREGFLRHLGSRQLAFVEGRNATVSVWESAVGRALKVNGKVDASDLGDMDTQIMLGIAPVAARPHATSALAIGFGSGVTTAMLAAVPGMERVRVVEIEPAVLGLAPLFRSVNRDVLSRPNVQSIVDDARSALQLNNDRFDVIVSEPSNPWVAGVATLYTPEFYSIVRARLAERGVFCQWIQLYQLNLPVVAGIIRNVRAVFPHVQVWLGAPEDIMVLGSDRPIVVDTAWVGSLVGPQGILAWDGREYLGIRHVEDYFSRLIMGERGVDRLLSKATLVHTDDRPKLEFVAARSFLSDSQSPTFDSLVVIGGAEPEPEGPSSLLFARGMAARLGNPKGLPYVRAAHLAHPEDPRWTVSLAAIGMALGDTTYADSVLPGLANRAHDPTAALMLGVNATVRKQPVPAQRFLATALAGGADTSRIEAALATLAADAARWGEAAVHVRSAVRSAHGTLYSAFPRDLLSRALRAISADGPPPLADSLLVEALRSNPGWSLIAELQVVVDLRSGACDQAADKLLSLLDFGIEKPEGPDVVARCRAARRPGR